VAVCVGLTVAVGVVSPAVGSEVAVLVGLAVGAGVGVDESPLQALAKKRAATRSRAVFNPISQSVVATIIADAWAIP